MTPLIVLAFFAVVLLILWGSTVLLEGLVILCSQKSLDDRKQWWKASLVCNTVTNPALNLIMFLLVAFLPAGVYNPILLLLEAAVIMMEAFFYWRMIDASPRLCLRISLIANLISFGAGWLIHLYLKAAGL